MKRELDFAGNLGSDGGSDDGRDGRCDEQLVVKMTNDAMPYRSDKGRDGDD